MAVLGKRIVNDVDDLDSLKTFIRQLGSHTIPTAEEEKTLLLRAQSGDIDARNELVERNMRLAVRIALRESGYSYPLQDLIADSTEAMIKAIAKFDIGRGVRLSTYITRWMQQHVRRRRLHATDKGRHVHSLDRGSLQDNGRVTTLHDTVPDPIDYTALVENRVDVAALLDILSNDERRYVALSYGLGDTARLSYREIAALDGRSHEWVRGIVLGALSKMRLAAGVELPEIDS